MTEVLTPLFQEDESTVLERMRQSANEGLSESSEDFTDTREGSIWFAAAVPGSKEIARLYDMAGTEMIQALLPQFSWGEYLNALASVQQLERTPPVAARVNVTFHAPDGTVIPGGTEVATSPPEGSGSQPVQFTTTESVTVLTGSAITVGCKAVIEGSSGNVGAGSINTLVSGVSGIESLSNANTAFGGAEEESDEELAKRLLGVYEGDPVAQVRWYIKTVQKWLSEHDGEKCPRGGRVSIKPLWEGAGTILVTAMDDSGSPLETAVVEALQTYLDPVSVSIEGAAPVGAIVTVKTGETLTVNVSATVTFKQGWNLDGHHGYIGTEAALKALITDAIDASEAGQEVVRMKIAAVIVEAEGLLDITLVKLNELESNVVPSAIQVARVGTITLTDSNPSNE